MRSVDTRFSAPILRDLVLVGGGHSHVAVLKRFGMKPVPGVRITVISRDVETPYSGMLPGHIAGHYDRHQAHIDLRPLCRFAGARLYHDSVVGLDLEGRRVRCAGRPPVAYDVLSLNVGSTPRTRGIDGAAEHGLPVKPVDGFIEGWRKLVQRLRARESGSADVVVVGGGAGGVELALATQYRLNQMLDPAPDRIRFHLVTDTEEILPDHAPGVARRFRRVLAERGVRVHTGHRVARVTPNEVVCDNGARLAADRIFLVTDGAPPVWIGATGLDTDESGFIRVEPTLRSTSHPEVFAAGDVAAMVGFPRPRSGVFAVRQGPPLARNLRRTLTGRALLPHRPQKRFLSLISTGDRYAVASWGPVALGGGWLWRVKDWIDRRWMQQWRELPEMEDSPGPGSEASAVATTPDARAVLATLALHPMRCGGCGAKVGAPVLRRALDRIRTKCEEGGRGAGDATGSGLVVGLDAADDAAVVEVPPGMVAIQSVDFFRAFLDDPWLFGRVAAIHALGDVWAMGGQPRWALAMATLPVGPEDKVEEQLFQLLAGATEALTRAGATLTGGHTGEGAELVFGLQVTGVAWPEKLLRKSGLQPGQRLILTQALGTGALFAADMRGEARSSWIDGALEAMLLPGAEAARVLERHGATACSDVTGFGLAGHLLEMLEASGVGAQLDLGSVALLDGALACVEKGIVSSLQPDNARLRRAVAAFDGAAESPPFALLFDPQTAGGLLASVPPEQAASCLDALHSAGYEDAADIGRVVHAGDPEAPLSVGI